jgi:branched-chain amino acid transport system ATP-binding protein
MGILEVRDVTKMFGGLCALNGVTFEVMEGEILGLIGPNGAGKTTVFNLITGLYKPTRGEIIYLNRNITKLKPHQRVKLGISRTFQMTKPFSSMSVLDNVLVSRCYGRNCAKSIKEARKEAEELLEFLGLAGKANTMAGNLNFVDKRLLELARALATQPRVLLLDEVMAGLNPREVDHVSSLIRKIRDMGVTILMIEHVMRAIMRLADRVVVLSAGMKIAEGKPSEVAKDEEVIKAYLGESFRGEMVT